MVPDNRNPKGDSAVDLEGTDINKQEQTTTKQLSTQSIYVNELRAKLRHPGEDRLHTTARRLYYNIRGSIEVLKDCNTVNSNKKYSCKVVEEQDLNMEKIIYFDINSQKKPSYGVTKKWILLQDSDTKQKWSFPQKEIIIID